MASINSSIFKTANSIDEIYNFFINKEFIENIDTDIESTILDNRNHKHFTIASDGSLLAIMSFKDTEDSKKAEKEFDNNFNVTYLLLIKNNISEYIFCKKDIGTGKILRLRKKKDNLENTFLKKLEELKFDEFDIFEKIFDRSEIIKDFYRLYSDCEKYVSKNIQGIPIENEREFFAKLLIERIMFLWFLQKKGFLNEDLNYLITKHNNIISQNKNFNKDFLKKLFFSGLCKKVNDRNEDIKMLLGDIPYLNGGLFLESEIEIKYGSQIELDNKIFLNKNMKYPISNEEKDIPILNLLDSKEWTIDERSGEVDKLNPEILGYIFERSINQKDLGAVYTPEEITDYISKNTIYNYLFKILNNKYKLQLEYHGDIENNCLKKLNNIQLNFLLEIIKKLRILDPAVGSGHFLVDGIKSLEEIYHFLYNKGIMGWSKYEIRQHIITENLFGVDILPGAIEICKLRMFLALAETFESKEDIHPLPNIEFNFRVGNSLIGFTNLKELSQKFLISSASINSIEKNMRFLRKYYPKLAEGASKIVSNMFNVSPLDLFKIRNELVKDYRIPKDDKEQQVELREVILEMTKAFNQDLNYQYYGQIKKIFNQKFKKYSENEKLQELISIKPFHWIMEFSEIFDNEGFDIIIENPPYLNMRRILLEQRIFEQIYPEIYNGQNDLLYYFFAHSTKIVKREGLMGFVTSRYFLESESAEKLRNFLLDNVAINKVIDFRNNQLFKGINVLSVVIILENNNSKKTNFNVIKFKEKKITNEQLIKIIADIHKERISNKILNFKMDYKKIKNKWLLYPEEYENIFNKVEQNTFFLNEDNHYRIGLGFQSGEDSVFVIDEDIIRFYNIEKNLIKPVIKNGDIRKYKINFRNKYLLMTLPGINIKEYPQTYKYLEEHKKIIEKRYEVRHNLCKWYELSVIRNPDIFESKGNKICLPFMATENRFAVSDVDDFICSNDVVVILEVNERLNYKILLAILNSNLMEFWHKNHSKLKRDGYYEYRSNDIKRIPIKKEIPKEYQEKIINLVDKLLSNENTKIINEINRVIYELYEINDKEKKIIEDFLKE